MKSTHQAVVKVTNTFNLIDPIDKFTLIGDPGCDGLGVRTMQTFASALLESQGSFILINGDIVPIGNDSHYRQMSDFINNLSTLPVYSLRGNHDSGKYEENFGLSNYVLFNSSLMIIALDNSNRKFSSQSLDLLEEALLQATDNQTVFLSFHIPPPNNFTTNTISDEHWQQLKKRCKNKYQKINFILCGHVHSGFVDQIDHIKLIVSGGGGARIEDVSAKIKASDVDNHIVRFVRDDQGKWHFDFVSLSSRPYQNEAIDKTSHSQLKHALERELEAHMRYMLYSERAARRGLSELSKLFHALSKSEYYHARNFFSLTEMPQKFKDELSNFIKNEIYESNDLYKFFADFAANNELPLNAYAFNDALSAEKDHVKLLHNAAIAVHQGLDIAEQKYFVCSSCGFMQCNELKRCPICGAPLDKIKKID